MAETNGTEATPPLTLEQASELIRQHMERMHAELYRIGRICHELVAQGVAGNHTYGGAELHLSPRLKELARQDLRRAFEVARVFTEEDCLKYGPRRLHLLVEYTLKFQLPMIPGDPGFMLITVLDEEGTLRRKPFCECTEEELGRAVGQLHPKESGRPLRAEAYCVQRLRDGLQKRLIRGSWKNVPATIHKGRIHVSLKNVPVAELEPLVGALLESLEPLHEEQGRRALAQRPRRGLEAPLPPYRASASGHSQAER
jgi:hypothetical protein